jgi:hypothetical protein
VGKKHRHRRVNVLKAAQDVGYIEGWSTLDEAAQDHYGQTCRVQGRLGIALVPLGSGYAKVLVWVAHLQDPDVALQVRSILDMYAKRGERAHVIAQDEDGYALGPLRIHQARAAATALSAIKTQPVPARV